MNSSQNLTIYDFTQHANCNSWTVVNDGVMGGLSKGKISITDDGNALFEGFLSTENNGGFSSVKYVFSKKEVRDFKSVMLRVKGDGKRYQFRIKSNHDQPFSYIKEFQTSGDWETITIPFNLFYASFRGNKLDMSNYDGQFMEEITFLVSTKKQEYFALEIERIWLQY